MRGAGCTECGWVVSLVYIRVAGKEPIELRKATCTHFVSSTHLLHPVAGDSVVRRTSRTGEMEANKSQPLPTPPGMVSRTMSMWDAQEAAKELGNISSKDLFALADSDKNGTINYVR